MSHNSSATLQKAQALSSGTGLGWGLLGVVGFSFTIPFTRIAVADGGMSPLFIGSARAVVAAVLAAAALALTRQPLPRGRQWIGLAIIAAGVVVGFPLLTSFAMQTVPAGHGAVVIALLPAATAVMAVLRGRDRPRTAFWITAGIGAVLAVVFAARQNGGLGSLHLTDLLLFCGVGAAAISYAEGALLSRVLGSWQTMCWALVLGAPLMVVLTGIGAAQQPPTGTPAQWLALTYLSVVSMFLAFFAWYRGLAIGPMAQVSQVQLVQPVLSICWAALLLRESLTWPTVLGGLAVVACAGLAVRTRLG
ncbi:DMT family transporter [Nocardia panacis]|uniref:DMT family transporter n=1 Tax=Nocardia panacis TaxID=2340916 RepID=A0A3A4KPS4_9NOCA|nr:DMT family transporter [Nocardia panacis]RJO77555.1 DMT family transporter [Nocardia panacis]